VVAQEKEKQEAEEESETRATAPPAARRPSYGLPLTDDLIAVLIILILTLTHCIPSHYGHSKFTKYWLYKLEPRSQQTGHLVGDSHFMTISKVKQ
jgi:hypothetical protein